MHFFFYLMFPPSPSRGARPCRSEVSPRGFTAAGAQIPPGTLARSGWSGTTDAPSLALPPPTVRWRTRRFFQTPPGEAPRPASSGSPRAPRRERGARPRDGAPRRRAASVGRSTREERRRRGTLGATAGGPRVVRCAATSASSRVGPPRRRVAGQAHRRSQAAVALIRPESARAGLGEPARPPRTRIDSIISARR